MKKQPADDRWILTPVLVLFFSVAAARTAPGQSPPLLRITLADVADGNPVTASPAVLGGWASGKGIVLVYQAGGTAGGVLASNSANGQILLDGGDHVVGTLTGGVNTITLTATNVAGQSASDGWTFYVGVSPLQNDQDADGIPDYWEQRFFGSPTNADPAADTDLDGAKDGQEYVAGTDPTNAASRLQLTRMEITRGSGGTYTTLEWLGGTNAALPPYVIQRSSAESVQWAPDFFSYRAVTRREGTNSYTFDETGPGARSNAFYRIVASNWAM